MATDVTYATRGVVSVNRSGSSVAPVIVIVIVVRIGVVVVRMILCAVRYSARGVVIAIVSVIACGAVVACTVSPVIV